MREPGARLRENWSGTDFRFQVSYRFWDLVLEEHKRHAGHAGVTDASYATFFRERTGESAASSFSKGFQTKDMHARVGRMHGPDELNSGSAFSWTWKRM